MSSASAIAVAVCVLAGLGAGVQAAVQGKFGERIGVVESVAFSSLVTSVLAVAVLLAARQSVGGLADGLRVPPWLWIGGVMSGFIIFAIALAPPRIGTTTTLALIISGNLVAAAAIDRFGWFGLERIGLGPLRILGLVLLGIGAALTLVRQ